MASTNSSRSKFDRRSTAEQSRKRAKSKTDGFSGAHEFNSASEGSRRFKSRGFKSDFECDRRKRSIKPWRIGSADARYIDTGSYKRDGREATEPRVTEYESASAVSEYRSRRERRADSANTGTKRCIKAGKRGRELAREPRGGIKL